MSVYEYAENQGFKEKILNFASKKFQKSSKELKIKNQQQIKISPNSQARWAKRNEAKFSVEFDYSTIMKNEVDKVQQFKDTVKLLDDNQLTQGLAHQIHL